MPSIKPKIQGYVEEEIFQAFQQWKAEQGIESISDALNELLKRFFGFEKATPAVGGLNKEKIESLDAKLVTIYTWARFAEERISKIEWRLKMEPEQSPLEESGAVEESKGDCEKSPLEERNWKIGDRVRVLCKSNYQGRLGSIIDFEERLGWHVAVDRWWEAVGVAESAIDERQRRAGNIWCDPSDMELIHQEPWEPEIVEGFLEDCKESSQGLEEESPLSSLEQEDLEANPLPIPPQSPEPPPISIRLTGLKQAELERRLKIAKGTLTKRRNRPDFKEWSRERDPNGVGWQWDAIARKYLAVE